MTPIYPPNSPTSESPHDPKELPRKTLGIRIYVKNIYIYTYLDIYIYIFIYISTFKTLNNPAKVRTSLAQALLEKCITSPAPKSEVLWVGLTAFIVRSETECKARITSSEG